MSGTSDKKPTNVKPIDNTPNEGGVFQFIKSKIYYIVIIAILVLILGLFGYLNNNQDVFKINNTNIKCDVTVIYYDNELKFNCKYNILGVEFEENISLVDILDVLIQINKYLKDYFRILNKKNWESVWFDKKSYAKKLVNDIQIRKFIKTIFN